MRWYELAAAQGDPDALNNMATCYFSGHGVPQDAREALRLSEAQLELIQGEAEELLEKMG